LLLAGDHGGARWDGGAHGRASLKRDCYEPVNGARPCAPNRGTLSAGAATHLAPPHAARESPETRRPASGGPVSRFAVYPYAALRKSAWQRMPTNRSVVFPW